jgi:hypothetical protein
VAFGFGLGLTARGGFFTHQVTLAGPVPGRPAPAGWWA